MNKNLQFTGQSNYNLKMLGITRKLPIIQIGPKKWIASFVMLGDTELTHICAKALIERLKGIEFNYFVVPEAKAIPLVETMCQLLREKGDPKNYIVLRKSVKSYVEDPLETSVRSITTNKKQRLVINRIDATKIRDKTVVIIDDVVSTGGTFKVMAELVKRVRVDTVFAGAVLKEGDSDISEIKEILENDIVFLYSLPIFIN